MSDYDEAIGTVLGLLAAIISLVCLVRWNLFVPLAIFQRRVL